MRCTRGGKEKDNLIGSLGRRRTPQAPPSKFNCSRSSSFDTVAVRSKGRLEVGKEDVHGDSTGVAGDFGLSDLQDAGETHDGQQRVKVRDVPPDLSGAG